MKTKSVSEASRYWVEGARNRSGRYASETPGAASDWEANTKSAAVTYKSAVSAANIDKMFSGGVAKAGAAKFARKVTDVGVGRFPTGVAAGEADYASGAAPFLETLAAMPKPAKKMRGDPANFDIVVKIGTALNKKRLSLRGA